MAEIDSCLVLCIEEMEDYTSNKVDTRLFVTYDFEEDTYVVYGKKQDRLNENKCVFVTQYVPFFFRFEKAKDVYQMIETIISRDSECSFTLNNYDNMPYDCESVNYYDLEKNMDSNYELVTYDNVNIRKKHVVPLIKMLKKAFNFY